MISIRTLTDVRRDESGVTLIETLVAIVMGLIVMGALFEILTVSLHQDTRITDRIQASQLGRTAMTKIVNELHSSCLAAGFTPVRTGSTASTLRFVNAYSEAGTIKPAEAAEHEIAFSSAAHTLTDKKFVATSGASPSEFVFSATASPAAGTRLASNVTQTEAEPAKPEPERYEPIFTYFKYTASATGTSEEGESTLAEVPAPLTATTAKTVAAVQVSFTTGPANGYNAFSRASPLKSLVTFAFTSPTSDPTTVDTPCQ